VNIYDQLVAEWPVRTPQPISAAPLVPVDPALLVRVRDGLVMLP
jgi:hypothetical protein